MYEYKLLKDELKYAVIGVYLDGELVAKVRVRLGDKYEEALEIKRALKALLPILDRGQLGVAALTTNLEKILVTQVFYEIQKTRVDIGA